MDDDILPGETEPTVFGRYLADGKQGEFGYIVPMDPETEYIIEEPSDSPLYRLEARPLYFFGVVGAFGAVCFWLGLLVGLS